MTSKWDGMHIEVGDYYLITTKNGAQYDGEIIALTKTTVTVEHWNEVKDRLDETDLKLIDITMFEGFNDSQITL